MRRLLLALASTAAGLAAVLSFKTHSSVAATGDVAAPATGAQSGAGASSAPASAGTAGSATAAPKKGTSGGSGGGSGGGTATKTRTVTGTVDNTQYGPMQVEVMLQGRKITDVKVLQQTNSGTESQQIDANAIPQLTRETLTAQSARIDAVSGASYTSAGYIKSLQSALDKA